MANEHHQQHVKPLTKEYSSFLLQEEGFHLLYLQYYHLKIQCYFILILSIVIIFYPHR